MTDLSRDDLHKLREIAEEVGRDVLNPDGGLPYDAEQDVIVETVCDIAQGSPHFLTGVHSHELSESNYQMIVGNFRKGRNDELVR